MEGRPLEGVHSLDVGGGRISTGFEGVELFVEKVRDGFGIGVQAGRGKHVRVVHPSHPHHPHVHVHGVTPVKHTRVIITHQQLRHLHLAHVVPPVHHHRHVG